MLLSIAIHSLGRDMDEQFETRPLLDPETLRALQRREDWPSAIRLSLNLGAFVLLVLAIIASAGAPLKALPLSLALAWVWSGLFAPFHECTHRTAFSSRRTNAIGAWLTGLPFGMAPAVYHTFHFEHHRHTQDPASDPELMNDPPAGWPTGSTGWLRMAAGTGLIQLKLAPLLGFSFQPESEWDSFARWHSMIRDRASVIRECRLLLFVWVTFILACLLWIPGGPWLLFAAWFAHVFQTLWIAAEHTGLPFEGNILALTRSVTSNAFVRWWLWNMNYHAEHHAWPGIPWHQLPAAHRCVVDNLESLVPSYFALHRNIIAARNTPSCDPGRR